MSAGRSQVLGAVLAETARRLNLCALDLIQIVGISESEAIRLVAGNELLAEGTRQWEFAALL